MTGIDVRDQVSLPLRRCFQLCLSGIRYRLFRSAITVTIVSLAVAFLMMMLSASTIDREVGRDIRHRTAGRRMLVEWVDKLSVPMTADSLSDRLAAAPQGGAFWQEVAHWGRLGEQELAALREVTRRRQAYDAFLRDLKPGERNVLVGTRAGDDVYGHLAQPGNLDTFFTRIKELHRQFTGDEKDFRKFVADFAATQPARQRVLAGHAGAVAALEKDLAGTPVMQLFARGDAGSLEQVRRHGYRPEESMLGVMKAEAVLALDAQRLASLLRDERMRGVVANRVKAPISQISPTHVYDVGSSLSGAKWLKEQVEETRRKAAASPVAGKQVIEPLDLSAERIVEVTEAQQEAADLSEVESRLSAASAGPSAGDVLGFDRRTIWLIVISFMVCVVGVANAMLMSVTERFREIATMKCLGALDSFIMIIFVMESSLQGLAGGLAGVAVGLLLGLVRGVWGFGLLAVTNLPGLMLLGAAGACLVAGVVLAALAAVYPAWVAARLAPMEAMRIE